MKLLIAMSGGVDSSVVAYLMNQMGHECVGCMMKLHPDQPIDLAAEHNCCTTNDVADAEAVASQLEMPFHVINFADDFYEKIILPFIAAYERGVTPNPCVDCNRFMKFDKLYAQALALGCSHVVTGHYAQIEYRDGKYLLKKATDPSKDQSYVLYSLTQEQLSRTLFPLGHMSKAETRALAEKSGFANANKPDSQDICFVPDGDYARVISTYTGKTYPKGQFVSTDGTVLGEHKGIIHYTIGQRKGLGLALKCPHYVCRICPESNTVVLGTDDEVYESHLRASAFHWISGETPSLPVRCKAKIRYRQPEQWATATVVGDGVVSVVFDEPQRAITPGQAVVLYDGDIVLGGGVIERYDI